MEYLLMTVSILMGISFLCSLFEAVLYSVPYSYVEVLELRGSISGKILKKMREDVSRPISAILTLDTLGDTIGSAFVGAAVASVLGEGNLLPFAISYAAAILLVGKVLPKTLGVRYGKNLARVLAWPMEILTYVLWPITVISGWVTKLVGVSAHPEAISAEEIQVMARFGRKAGALGGMEETVIRNILNLRKVRAREIMTPRPVVFALPRKLTLREVREMSSPWPWPHSRVPVYEGDIDKIVGVVHRREVLAALAEDKEDLQLSHLVRPVHMVPEVATADVLLKEFIERKEHLFVVLDEYGGVAGVVTLEDVFETILGQEIVDESDLTEDMQEIARERKGKILGQVRR